MRLEVIDKLEIPGVIDVHSHFMPHSVLKKVWQVFDQAVDVFGTDWPITYRTDEEERVQTLRELGVVRFTSLLYAHKAGMSEWLNRWAAQFALSTPDCIHSATFFPESGVIDYVDTALDAGARLFKIHLQVGAFDPRDPQLSDVWARLSRDQIPTVVHCGSGPLPGPFTGIEPITDVLRNQPDLPLVAAHMGAPEYGDFLALSREFPNVYLDTTMAFTDFMNELAPFPEGMSEQLVEAGARGRILFGSDFPNIPYPYESAIAALERLGLGDEWLRGVLHDSAANLLATPDA